MQERHAIIERLREQMPDLSVRKLCQQCSVNRAWYYRHRRSAKVQCDQQLCQAITELRKTFAGYQERSISPGLIHHSDRGRQYCSAVYINRLLEVGVQISMSAAFPSNGECFRRKFLQDREV